MLRRVRECCSCKAMFSVYRVILVKRKLLEGWERNWYCLECAAPDVRAAAGVGDFSA